MRRLPGFGARAGPFDHVYPQKAVTMGSEGPCSCIDRSSHDDAFSLADFAVNAPPDIPVRNRLSAWWRLWPLAFLGLVAVLAVAMGWHRALTLETLIRHREAIGAFVAGHGASAIAAYIGLYIVAVALSLPGGSILTLAGGILFGTVIGGAAASIGATIGATFLFLIARSTLGVFLTRRAGPFVAKVAQGFREDAFSYLLFLRLVPLFPFWLVNLAPALCGVSLPTFVAATAIGILPATFAFAFCGAGLDSVLAAQEGAYRACLASGHVDCRLDFDVRSAITPELLWALVALGLVALVPVALKYWRARHRV
jgi:uncharacterized membrane protein YdjX (TVP38/TMEM64 family)